MFMQMAARRRRRAGSAAPSLSQQVQAILAGTTGFALDPSDTATMWQDSAKTTPVTTAAQPVGAIRTKWGAAQFDFLQSTAGARPAWDGTRFITFDGIDDRMQSGAQPVLKVASGYYIAARHGGINSTILNSSRLAVLGLTGRLRTVVKRLDADGATTFTGLDSSVMGGATVAYSQDLSVDGSTVVYRNNTFVESIGTLAGTPGPSDNTDLGQITLLNNSGGAYSSGPLGRMVVLPFVPSSGQRATIEAWLAEV